ncbi:MAG TPA: branched-chain amino acid ABC transporter permease [Candidatus Limnocylindrales bacterium]|nr:branched-chain amino acid ABC transporter permease [Candidatus Limnocylindrales bacterium]
MQEFFQQLANGVAWGSIYALIALGYTMVYGTLRLINFAHGDVYMVGAFAAYFLARALGVGSVTNASPLAAALVLLGSMAICAALGVLIELFAYRPVRKSSRITALITAIGVSLFLENAGILIFGPDPKFFPQVIAPRTIRLAEGVFVTNHQITVVLVSVVLMVALTLFIKRTRTGKAMRAVSFSRDAASLMGIPVDRIITITFAIGSALAAAAGFLVGLTNPKIEPLMGIMPGIKAFVAAVLGGIGSIPGAMIGGLLMGISEYLVVGYISSTYRDAIAFVILIVVLLIRPAGLLGRNVAEKV